MHGDRCVDLYLLQQVMHEAGLFDMLLYTLFDIGDSDEVGLNIIDADDPEVCAYACAHACDRWIME